MMNNQSSASAIEVAALKKENYDLQEQIKALQKENACLSLLGNRTGSMGMLPIHERMAEIWTKKCKQLGTAQEESEMVLCLNANASYFQKLADLKNLSLAASMINDVEWLHQICGDIEKLEGLGLW